MDAGFDRSKFKETSREALMWKDEKHGGFINLVIKSGVRGELPKDLAWVFPLPDVPVEYREVDGVIFEELNKFFSKYAPQPRSAPNGLIAKEMVPQGIIIHEKETVGDYEIVPIEIVNEDSGDELNEWLGSQGYATMSDETQRPYLKKGAAFLAIKIKPATGNVDLKPLLIKYRGDEMRFPLRFSHDDRTFDLNLYLIHDGDGGGVTGVPYEVLKGWGLRHHKLGEVVEECPALRGLVGDSGSAKVIRMALHGVNSEFMVRDLSEDPGI